MLDFLWLMILLVSPNDISCKQKSLKGFVEEIIGVYKENNFKCQSEQVAYLLWLQEEKSFHIAEYCALKAVQNEHKSVKKFALSFLFDLYTKHKQSKKANFIGKQVSSKKIINSQNFWYFLGPFQIGKSELDGNPMYGTNENTTLSSRWNSKFTALSELGKNGQVRWSKEIVGENGAVNLMPNVDWNDLIRTMQSIAITEWQGLLVSEFLITKSGSVRMQCLGVNVFYVDGKLVNGDLYHRDEYWFPLHLKSGIHVVKVPVRAKGHAVVKCVIDLLKDSSLVIHRVKFLPDLVAGNLFSNLASFTVTNMNALRSISVTTVSVTDTELEALSVELIGNADFHPGQISSLIVKFNDKRNDIISGCKKESFRFHLRFSTNENIYKDVDVFLRCRNINQSFLFTFLDHDSSLQHAAAIKPLEPCMLEKCPVLLTLHGTGVSSQNQADSYKYMKSNTYVFGVSKLWLLAPTRHGAHNWEGPGEMTALRALKALSVYTQDALNYLGKAANDKLVVVAGHSMGGHGAWQISTHHPDLCIAVVSAAGWLSKESYGDSNLFYHHDISLSHVSPSVKTIQEACIAENQVDKLASNLKGLPVLIRVGSDDKTVHPYFSRRMFRLLKENTVNVSYKEITGKEHWWWDTKRANDGGVTNDFQMRSFATRAVEFHESLHSECASDGCDRNGRSKYKKQEVNRRIGRYRYIVFNPASFSGGCGVTILQQVLPLRRSEYEIEITFQSVTMTTSNIFRLNIAEPYIGRVGWKKKEIMLDGTSVKPQTDLPWQLCFVGGVWRGCETPPVRGRHGYGPARRVAEKEFAIAICNSTNADDNNLLHNAAVFLANQFYSTSNSIVKVVQLNGLSENLRGNMILLGTEECTSQLKLKKLIMFTNETVTIGKCNFTQRNISAIYLLPHNGNLVLLLTSNTAVAIHSQAIQLAFSTIPPMTRSPFSNLVPDYVVLSANVRQKGPGAYLCSGFWGNNWNYEPAISSCVC